MSTVKERNDDKLALHHIETCRKLVKTNRPLLTSGRAEHFLTNRNTKRWMGCLMLMDAMRLPPTSMLTITGFESEFECSGTLPSSASSQKLEKQQQISYSISVKIGKYQWVCLGDRSVLMFRATVQHSIPHPFLTVDDIMNDMGIGHRTEAMHHIATKILDPSVGITPSEWLVVRNTFARVDLILITRLYRSWNSRPDITRECSDVWPIYIIRDYQAEIQWPLN